MTTNKRVLSEAKVLTASDMRLIGLKSTYSTSLDIKGSLIFEKPVSISDSILSGNNSIGFMSYIRGGATLSNIKIGRFCSIAPNVLAGAGQHPMDWMSTHPFVYGGSRIFKSYDEYTEIAMVNNFSKKGRKKTIIIGNDVWIGEGAYISPGVQIGDGAVIAAKSVVTKNVEPYTIVAGVPAKPIKKRFPDTLIKKFQTIKWWNYDLASSKEELDYTNPESVLNALERLIDNNGINLLEVETYQLVDGKISGIIVKAG
jgi:acetyltransferase-like isoleucine patch superfamily enzyme